MIGFSFGLMGVLMKKSSFPEGKNCGRTNGSKSGTFANSPNALSNKYRMVRLRDSSRMLYRNDPCYVLLRSVMNSGDLLLFVNLFTTTEAD
jgi:hypothetical protein